MGDEGEEVSNLWVFGYGSLVWKPGFAFTESKVGFVRGYVRRFFQGNDVQRGSKDKVRRDFMPCQPYEFNLSSVLVFCSLVVS